MQRNTKANKSQELFFKISLKLSLKTRIFLKITLVSLLLTLGKRTNVLIVMIKLHTFLCAGMISVVLVF